MKVFRHKGHNAYCIKNKLVIIKKNKDNKIKFYFKAHGFENLRFRISPHHQWKYWHWTIRIPFFYWQKHNGGHEIGLPNCYLWVIK